MPGARGKVAISVLGVISTDSLLLLELLLELREEIKRQRKKEQKSEDENVR